MKRKKRPRKNQSWLTWTCLVLVLLSFATLSSFVFFLLLGEPESQSRHLYHGIGNAKLHVSVDREPFQKSTGDASGKYIVMAEIGLAVRRYPELDSQEVGYLHRGDTFYADKTPIKLMMGSDSSRRTRMHITAPFDGWVTSGTDGSSVLVKAVPETKEKDIEDKSRGSGNANAPKQLSSDQGPTVNEVCTATNFHIDKDMKGGDLRPSPANVKTPEECCRLCFWDKKCVGFTLVGGGSCWLKQERIELTAGKELISGVLPDKRNMLTGNIGSRRAQRIEYEEIPPEKPVYCCKEDSDNPQLLIGKKKGRNELWFDNPAKNWETVFPVGNGHMGALLGWDPMEDVIAISEETLVTTHVNASSQSPDKHDVFMKMRDLLVEKKFKEAQETASHTDAREIGMYEYAGDIVMSFFGLEMKAITEYVRSLDLSSGVSSSTFLASDIEDGKPLNGVEFEKEAFLSAVDDVLVIRLKCQRPKSSSVTKGSGCLNVDFTIRRDGEPKKRQSLVVAGPVQWKLGGKPTYVLRLQKSNTKEKEVVPFELCMAVAEGQLSGEGALSVRNSEELVVLVTVQSSYYHDDPHKKCMKTLEAAAGFGFNKLLRRHTEDHKSMFGRVDFSLGSATSQAHQCDSWYPTDERVRRFSKDCIHEGTLLKSGQKVEDLSLYTLFYQFGRYLLMGASRAGSKPANLQGVWANSVESPWGADYHMNINLQMNYWGAQTGNLAETMAPYTTFVKDLSASGGKQTAHAYYRCPGWVAHGFTDLWMEGGLLGNCEWSLCPVCGAWSALSLWETYEYQKNTSFLQNEALPVLEGAVEFFLCYTFQAPEYGDILLSGPSTSPENSFKVIEDPPKDDAPKANAKGKRKPKGPQTKYYSITISPTFDTAVLYELFTVYLQACQILSSCLLVQQVITARSKLPNKGQPLVGEDGMIQEYLDYQFSKLHDPGHRHFSGLYALYPGRQVSLYSSPALAAAALKTLQHKVDNGGGHTNWSAAWMVSLWARLGESQKAGESLEHLMKTFVKSNLLTAHPKLDGFVPGCTTCYQLPPKPKRRVKQPKKNGQQPLNKFKTADGALFQIDGNFGAVAAIHEILLQSHEGGVINLLPSLPNTWAQGSIKGLVVRGGHEVNLFWEKSKLSRVEVQIANNFEQDSIKLRYSQKLQPAGQTKNTLSSKTITYSDKDQLIEIGSPPKGELIVLQPGEESILSWLK